MTDTTQLRSATIYQFPAGGRAALSIRRETTKPVVADFVAPRAPKIAYGGSWYHEEAISEAAGNILPRRD